MQGSKKNIERGQSITFRIPSDTPDYLLKQLQKLKETERRNFSSQIAQYVLKGVNETYTRERETVTIPLPRQLTKEQKNWLKHEHSEALIGSIVYQLLQDPMRATSIMSTLNGGRPTMEAEPYVEEEEPLEASEDNVPDLDSVDLDQLDDLHQADNEETEETGEDPLADFFSKMNK
ncbi:hypothetical protein [Lentibacillus amyloliquefaciens]|uniref:Uncharacterized protein n=1 Tax=Lentibacillus amyloliquefaciens TaxID=1472767 RepID=A0A0U3W9A2_9BACI|nr:hypothetical protein [Lentibacillus amyloliquefaciens]ALX49680.1 hypothetical protein AOX59_14545 [Lentibacillus amyloliquefaciens]